MHEVQNLYNILNHKKYELNDLVAFRYDKKLFLQVNVLESKATFNDFIYFKNNKENTSFNYEQFIKTLNSDSYISFSKMWNRVEKEIQGYKIGDLPKNLFE